MVTERNGGGARCSTQRGLLQRMWCTWLLCLMGTPHMDGARTESGIEVERELELDFGRCRLCVQAPVASGLGSARELGGAKLFDLWDCGTR